MKKLSLALITAAVSLPMAASAAVISWDSASGDYIGMSDSATTVLPCSSGDKCAVTQTWDLGGNAVTGDAYLAGGGGPIVLWHDARPGGGGLGSAPRDGLGDSSNDNNVGAESIHLTFDSSVYINNLLLNGNHIAFNGFITVNSDAGVLANSVLTGGVLNLGGVEVTELWVEAGQGQTDPWYVSGVDYDNVSVPEPASLLLLGAGMMGLGIARRRKA